MTTIAVIGTGNVGGALGTAAVKAGYDVVFAGQDVAKTREVAEAAGATAARDAARGRCRLRHHRARRPVHGVRRGRRRDRPGRGRQDRHRPLEPDQARLLGPRTVRTRPAPRSSPASSRTSKVVKAFNTLFAGNTANPEALGFQLDSLFATDDEAAKDAVCGLSASIGFRPIHIGPLTASRELEAMAWLNIRLQMVSNGNWNTAFALVSPPEAALTYGK